LDELVVGVVQVFNSLEFLDGGQDLLSQPLNQFFVVARAPKQLIDVVFAFVLEIERALVIDYFLLKHFKHVLQIRLSNVNFDCLGIFADGNTTCLHVVDV
jgi:hypothetical protein